MRATTGRAFLPLLFLAAFGWTLISTTLVQQVLAPRLFPAAAQTGLVYPDARYFHVHAARLAEKIGSEGWSAWELRPEGHAPVGITAIIYEVTGPHPWVVLWLNAALHATAFLLLTLIVERIARIGRWSAVAALPFLLLPSALVWTAGIAKDGFSILGFYACALGMLELIDPPRRRWTAWARGGCLLAVGMALAQLVRPYAAELLAIGIVGALLVYAVAAAVPPLRSPRAGSVALALAALVAASSASVVNSTGSLALSPQTAVQYPSSVPFQTGQAAVDACWSRPSWLPAPVDAEFRRLAYARAALYLETPTATTSFADAHAPCSPGEVAVAAPRSLLNGLLAPWPNQWWRPDQPVQSLAAVLEMILVYGGLAALVLHGHRLGADPSPSSERGSVLLLPLLALCLAEIALLALALPNVGTLMRLRYAPMMLLVGLGLAALVRRRQLIQLPPSTL
jgi:hypothetical protein